MQPELTCRLCVATFCCMGLQLLTLVTAVTVTAQASLPAGDNQTQRVTEHRIEQILRLPCLQVTFADGTSVLAVAEVFSRILTAQGGTPIQFLTDCTELDAEGSDDLSEVSLEAVHFAAGTNSVFDIMEAVFSQTMDPRLTFVPNRGYLLLTTLDNAESDEMLVTRAHDVRRIVPCTPRTVLLRREGTRCQAQIAASVCDAAAD